MEEINQYINQSNLIYTTRFKQVIKDIEKTKDNPNLTNNTKNIRIKILFKNKYNNNNIYRNLCKKKKKKKKSK